MATLYWEVRRGNDKLFLFVCSFSFFSRLVHFDEKRENNWTRQFLNFWHGNCKDHYLLELCRSLNACNACDGCLTANSFNYMAFEMRTERNEFNQQKKKNFSISRTSIKKKKENKTQ